MLKFFIGALLIITALETGFGQKNNVLSEPKHSLRFNILGLTDVFDQNATFGIERRFHTNWSAGTDAGWVFHSVHIQNVKSTNGVIIRPFLRYYPYKRTNFWEVELHYKYVTYKIEDWLGRVPVNNVPAYEEYTTFNLHKQAAGIHFKWGIQANLSGDKKFKFEFTTGLGLRFKSHKVPGGIYTNRSRINNITPDTYSGPVVPVNLRLVYVIK